MEVMNKNDEDGFTLIELLTVISIIAVLAGLILSTAGYIQRKAATSRAQTEIKAMEAAAESYKADNGIYPSGTNSDLLKSGSAYAASNGNPSNYTSACAILYQAITGDGNNLIGGATASTGHSGTSGKCYMELKPSQTATTSGVIYIVDPFGFSYGYSTAQASNTTAVICGYNTTFDLWSTAGTTTGSQTKWITNW